MANRFPPELIEACKRRFGALPCATATFLLTLGDPLGDAGIIGNMEEDGQASVADAARFLIAGRAEPTPASQRQSPSSVSSAAGSEEPERSNALDWSEDLIERVMRESNVTRENALEMIEAGDDPETGARRIAQFRHQNKELQRLSVEEQQRRVAHIANREGLIEAVMSSHPQMTRAQAIEAIEAEGG